MQMKQLIHEYDRLGLESRIFPRLEEAMAWLESR